MTTNFQRTAAWLKACGKEPSASNLSLQIGCHIEETTEFLDALTFEIGDEDEVWVTLYTQAVDNLKEIANMLKSRRIYADFGDEPGDAEHVLDALCDMEVTGNGVAYFAGFDKDGADQAVLASNDAKLVDGKPVILLGGKIGKPEGWQPPNLTPFI